jgi:hypothetical protein
VYVVAIAELNAAIEIEAAALSSDLGVGTYEARLMLASGTPAIVSMTLDKARALDLLVRLRTRGHGAIACDASAVVASDAMTSMRSFALGPRSMSSDGGARAELPYDDVLALIAAVHRQRATSEGEVRESTFSVARAVMTGGIVTTKTVKRSTRASTEEREAVLYIFRRDGGPPWILRENGTRWAGHGRPLAPSAGANFRTAVGVLRERMPGAVYDDRLVGRKSAPERIAVAAGAAGTTMTSSSEAGIDLLAHLLATWISRARAGG